MKQSIGKIAAIILAIALAFTFALQTAFADDIVPEDVTDVTVEEVVQEGQDLEQEPGSGSEEQTDVSETVISEETSFNSEAKGDIKAAETVTGTFNAIEGYEIATIRYYTDADKTAYHFADFTYDEASGKYSYSFEAPYSGFTSVQGSQMRDADPAADATVIAYYYSLSRWDGAVDVTWYNETDADFYIYNPAQLAGVAAIVNGNIDGLTENYEVRGYRSDLTGESNKGLPDFIVSDHYEETTLAAQARGPADKGRKEHDFKNRTIHLMSDMDMGGTDGSDVYMAAGYDIAVDDPSLNWNRNLHKDEYPNWTPIGGEYLMDVEDYNTMNIAFFNGVLDGNGHSIENLYCYRWSYRKEGYSAFGYSQGVGLIGAMACLYDDDRGTETQPELMPGVRDLSLSGFVYGRRMVGGIAGVVGGGVSSVDGNAVTSGVTFENIANHAYAYCTDAKGLGGIIGSSYVKGSIINCYNTGRIEANYPAPTGGIVGANEGMDIFCCYNTGTIYTNGNSRGRGIGADGGGSDYTVDNCYYIYGCGDDNRFPGYYDDEAGSSVSVDVQPASSSQFTDGTVLSGLNQNGLAYVSGNDGYPILYWESNSGSGTAQIIQPQGGAISAYTRGSNVGSGETFDNGTIIYLSQENESGWQFRYYTLNGNPLSGDYVTINGDSTVSAFFESSKAGALKIADNSVCNISVVKTGIIKEDGQTVNVTDYPVASGDPIFEGDILTVTATVKEGMVPENEDLMYSYSAGLENCFDYGYTYTGGEETVTSVVTYTVTSEINAEGVSLTLDVKPRTTQKLWRYIADTSWYNTSSSTFTLTTAAQLAGLAVLVDGGNSFQGKTIKLGSDVSFTNTDGTNGRRFWDGMGSAQTGFAGTFDGQGYKITDFHSNQNALISYLSGTSASSKATLKNLDIYGTADGPNACGLVYTAKNASITNCNVYMAISGTSGYIGGVVGNAATASTITNCNSYGNITCATTGSAYIGGIAGKLAEGNSAENCINKGDITVTTTNTNYIGGAFGQIQGPVTKCANYGDIVASGRYIGGLIGNTNKKTAVVTDCYNAGDVTLSMSTNSLDSVGGLVGNGGIHVISNCFNVGNVRLEGCDTNYIGGIIGKEGANSNSSTSNVYMLDSTCDYADNKVAIGNLTSAAYHAGMRSASAEEFASASGVITAINGNNSFISGEAFPEFASISGLHVHSGGTATCVNKAVCEVCGLEYGTVDPNNHPETHIANASEPAWVYDGNTGDTECLYCGAIVEHGQAIPADTSVNAITINVIKNDSVTETRTYTRAEFDALKETTPIAYAYGAADGKEKMVSTEYVTLDTIYAQFGYTIADVEKIAVKCAGTTDIVMHDNLVSKCEYHEGGTVYAAPAAIAMKYVTGFGDLATVATKTLPNNNLRFGYGMSAEQYDAGADVGGRRCVSPVISLDIYVMQSPNAGISGSISGYSGTGAVTITLTKEGATEPVMTCTGMDTYSLEGVEPGIYTLNVSAGTQYVPRDYTVTVGTEDIICNVQISLLGDIDQNGRVGASDITLLMRHVSRTSIISDEYVLKLCDTDRDGNIRSADITRLSRYVSRIINEL